MDMRTYASKYIKPDPVRDGPIQTRVIRVFEDERYARPTLELENGSQFGLNEGNCNVLINAWGYNSDDWIGQEIQFVLGTYENWKTDPPSDAETVKVIAISPVKMAGGNSGALSKPALPPSRIAARRNEMDFDDSVPLLCA